MPTAEKAGTIEELRKRLGGATAAVLTEYRGLTVQQISELRKQLKAASAEYRVVKNRLARVAIEGSALASLRPHLTGPIGVVIARKDPAPVAKALQGFAKTYPALQVRMGVVDGQLLDPQGLKAVADLPSREALRSQLVGAIQGPLAQLVRLLQAPQRELAFILAERGKQAPTESAEQASRTESDERGRGPGGSADDKGDRG